MRFIKKFWNWSQPGVPDAPLEVKIFALVAWPFGIASFLIMLYGLVILTNHIVDRIVPPPSEVYVENIKSAIVKYNAEDYLGAIEDLTIAIKLEPDSALAYYFRGSSRFRSEDYKGAIEDLTIAIDIKSDYTEAFARRGLAKYRSEDYLGAIEDLTIAIKIKPDFAAAYNVRGSAKVKLGQSSAGCLDWNKAGELGNEKAYDLFKEYCQ